jgi:hypothetical protein
VSIEGRPEETVQRILDDLPDDVSR